MKLREALLEKKRVKVGSGTGFVYCGDREVVEQYKSIVDPNVDIIIFEGDEEGAYWDEEEYVKANGPFEEVEA